MDYVVSSLQNGYQEAAWNAANEQLGDLEHSMLDAIMFCFPPSDDQFFAVCLISITKAPSIPTKRASSSVQVQMHEIGHTIGLTCPQHTDNPAKANTNTAMQPAFWEVVRWTRIEVLFVTINPQTNYQLGWYDDDKAEPINPLDGAGKARVHSQWRFELQDE